jgi:beta-glucanase (GH16 family)
MFSKAIAVISTGLVLTRAAPPAIPGFSLTWSDDFIGISNSLPNPSNWIVDTGTGYPGGPTQWGTWEVQSYTSRPENLKLTGDGVLQITPLRDANNKWTSARIETQRSDFMAKAGGKMRISARIIMPNITGEAAVGYWPAFWTLGSDYRGNYQNWPSVGEYDIMEVGSAPTSRSCYAGTDDRLLIERERHQQSVGRSPLRSQSRRPLQRDRWSARQHSMPRDSLPG